ncbi:MAG: enolase C-terminal domain-like protein [Bacteroidota bacterium]|nr:enolase C-terminal domain-like protein [Bacteroidota bacterium]
MLHWTIEKVTLHLKYTWKISRNATNVKTNFFIKVSNKGYEGFGEVAPNIRYQETPEKILSEFAMVLNNELSIVRNYDKLKLLLSQFKISNALKTGIEEAYLDLMAKIEKSTVSEILGLKEPINVGTAFTIPIMDVEVLGNFFLRHNIHRFPFVKVKVDKETGLETVKEIHNLTDQPLILDANESWTDLDELLWFFDNIKDFKIEFVEQPMPAHMDEAYFELKPKSPFKLFADESITNAPDFVKIKRQFDGVNIKLSKSGGMENAFNLIKNARLFGLKTMIGCMVETTLGISNGIYFGSEVDYVDLDSFMYLENEPLSLIKEENGILSKV